jgi:exonuclease VII small subunit
MTRAVQVEDCIALVMARHPETAGPARQARYYEEVHQELAPLARRLEQERDQLRADLAVGRERHSKLVAHSQSQERDLMDVCERRDGLIAELEQARQRIATLVNLNEKLSTTAAARQIVDADGEVFKPGQWWIEELKRISTTQAPDLDQVRAVAVALRFARIVFAQATPVIQQSERLAWVRACWIDFDSATPAAVGEALPCVIDGCHSAATYEPLNLCAMHLADFVAWRAKQNRPEGGAA